MVLERDKGHVSDMEGSMAFFETANEAALGSLERNVTVENGPFSCVAEVENHWLVPQVAAQIRSMTVVLNGSVRAGEQKGGKRWALGMMATRTP